MFATNHKYQTNTGLLELEDIDDLSCQKKDNLSELVLDTKKKSIFTKAQGDDDVYLKVRQNTQNNEVSEKLDGLPSRKQNNHGISSSLSSINQTDLNKHIKSKESAMKAQKVSLELHMESMNESYSSNLLNACSPDKLNKDNIFLKNERVVVVAEDRYLKDEYGESLTVNLEEENKEAEISATGGNKVLNKIINSREFFVDSTIFNDIVFKPYERKPVSEEDIRSFAFLPIPKGKKLSCNIVREKEGKLSLNYKYHIYCNNNGRYLLSAIKRADNMSSNYMVLTNKTSNLNSEAYIGKIRSNFMGLEYNAYDTGMNVTKTKNENNVRRLMATITYKLNMFGLSGPREMTVYIPKVNEYNGQISVVKQLKKDMTLKSLFDETGIEVDVCRYFNKKPRWVEDKKAYALDFDDRVEVESTKNFKILRESSQVSKLLNKHEDHELMQFGKINEDVFSMDFKFPLSLFQALAIGISSLDRKIGCE